jgi:hypothetical protein
VVCNITRLFCVAWPFKDSNLASAVSLLVPRASMSDTTPHALIMQL